MKKLLLTLIIFIILTGCAVKESDISKIEIVNTANGEKTVLDNSSQSFKTIINALNKKDKTKENVSGFSYELYFNKGNQIDAYIMNIDVDNENIFIKKDETVYKVKKDICSKLLQDENFSFAYINKTINKAYLLQNGESKNLNIQYDWVYSDINGKINEKSGILSDNSENQNKLTIKDSDKVVLKFDVEPDSQITRVYKEGNAVYTGKSISDAVKYIKNDGEYFIETEIKWNKKSDVISYGNQTVSFVALIDRKADFDIVTKENFPGNILVVKIKNLNEDETVKLSTAAVKIETDMYQLNEDGFDYATIMPIDLDTKPGVYGIIATFNEGKENEYTKAKEINVLNKTFKTQYLTVSEDLNQSNNDDKSIEEFVKVVKPARTITTPEKLWDGEFLMPVEGELTTDFAEIRYVNNEQSSSRHSGIDISAQIGTKVIAPNNGRVALVAKNLLSPGNTLVIDHGMGLFTSYYHLNTIDVEEGKDVKKGDVIATVGSTGFSTGPHLHYAVSIYNTYVNTYQIMGGIIE